ncbi:30S ribosomal protein S18 [Candidatus Parcubacteria bacterium]|nr:MAG: 30S ribosomal protein S18 [Candidatus Parcubacteria bacterium]
MIEATSQKQCFFCTSNVKHIDYKNADALRHYLNPQAKIIPRKKSGCCAKHQRKLTEAIRRARIMGLLPFVPE